MNIKLQIVTWNIGGIARLVDKKKMIDNLRNKLFYTQLKKILEKNNDIICLALQEVFFNIKDILKLFLKKYNYKILDYVYKGFGFIGFKIALFIIVKKNNKLNFSSCNTILNIRQTHIIKTIFQTKSICSVILKNENIVIIFHNILNREFKFKKFIVNNYKNILVNKNNYLNKYIFQNKKKYEKFIGKKNNYKLNKNKYIFIIGDFKSKFERCFTDKLYELETDIICKNKKLYKKLMEEDLLNKFIKRQIKWQEPRLKKFAVTYKYIPNTNNFFIDTNDDDRRCLSWNDRIIHYKNKNLKCIRYEILENIKLSTHKPVQAFFTINN